MNSFLIFFWEFSSILPRRIVFFFFTFLQSFYKKKKDLKKTMTTITTVYILHDALLCSCRCRCYCHSNWADRSQLLFLQLLRNFHFRLLKVYRTHYFRLICSMLIYQRKKRWDFFFLFMQHFRFNLRERALSHLIQIISLYVCVCVFVCRSIYLFKVRYDGSQSNKIHVQKVEPLNHKKYNLFIQAILMNPAVVSLKGYADINRALLSSVCVANFHYRVFFYFFGFFFPLKIKF